MPLSTLSHDQRNIAVLSLLGSPCCIYRTLEYTVSSSTTLPYTVHDHTSIFVGLLSIGEQTLCCAALLFRLHFAVYARNKRCENANARFLALSVAAKATTVSAKRESFC